MNGIVCPVLGQATHDDQAAAARVVLLAQRIRSSHPDESPRLIRYM
jgi:hypothetical protein